LDSGIYKVTFQDGRTNEYAANVIIESIFQQVDAEGNSFTYFSEITDHRADDTALNIDNGYVLKNGDLVPHGKMLLLLGSH
jgi:ABC-type lipopolysaccharide export system ATPase subunit